MKVFTATVTHRHGTDTYVARTQEGVTRELANYARDYWDEADLPLTADGKPLTDGMTDEEIVSAYFGVMNERETEYFDLCEAELAD